MKKETKNLLRSVITQHDIDATRALWAALGPDAIPDLFYGGRERQSERFALGLLAGETEYVGLLVIKTAIDYLDSLNEDQ